MDQPDGKLNIPKLCTETLLYICAARILEGTHVTYFERVCWALASHPACHGSGIASQLHVSQTVPYPSTAGRADVEHKLCNTHTFLGEPGKMFNNYRYA